MARRKLVSPLTNYYGAGNVPDLEPTMTRLTLEEAASTSGLSYGQVYRRVVQNKEVPGVLQDGRWTISSADLHLLQPYVATVDTRPGVTLRVSEEEFMAWRKAARGKTVSQWLLGLARKTSGWEP